MKSDSDNRLEGFVATEDLKPVIERFHSLALTASRSRNWWMTECDPDGARGVGAL
ncbi:hypothetical protein M378DRAFT_164762, partial [Amanita muscaria Koide BX008]